MGGKQGVLVEQFHQLFHLVLHCSTGQYYKSRYSICLHTILSSTKKCSIRNLSCSSCGEASKKIMKIPLRWNIYHNKPVFSFWREHSNGRKIAQNFDNVKFHTEGSKQSTRVNASACSPSSWWQNSIIPIFVPA
jgi:hypothetical protein